MTRALLVPGPALAPLRDRLARLGVDDQLVAPEAGCADTLEWFARNLSGRTLIIDGGAIAAEAAIGQLVDDPAVTNGVLTLPTSPEGPGGTALRVRQRRVVSAGSVGLVAAGSAASAGAGIWSGYTNGIPSCWGLPPEQELPPAPGVTVAELAEMFDVTADRPPAAGLSDLAPAMSAGVVDRGSAPAADWAPAPLHQVSSPNATSMGALVVSAGAVQLARETLRAAGATARELGWVADPVDVALVALVRAQVPISAVGLVGPGIRRGTQAEREGVVAELGNLDEQRVLLERANRPDDGFYSTFVLRKLSKPLTAAALKLRLTPNQISLFSLLVGLCAAAAFAVGTWPMLLVGAFLLQASLTIDCVDGEVARFTRSFSAFGAWLDAATDRVKEYAAYAGLALGAANQRGEDLWLLAALVMVMQTVRHIGDYDFSRVQRIRESWVPATPIADLSDGGTDGGGATLALSAQLNERRGVHWFKKVLHMPIGERWLVISIGAITVGPRWTFVIMLALGLIALAYTTAGRILRARNWHHEPEQSGAWLLEPQLDLGPFGEPIWSALFGRRRPLAGAFGWAIPALLRLFEFALVWVIALWLGGWRLDGLPGWGAAWVFAWLFVVAFHHYDTLYRALGRISPPDWLVWSGLGWDGRSILVVLLTLGGVAAFCGLMQWGSLVLFVLLVVVASVQWVRQMRGREPIDG